MCKAVSRDRGARTKLGDPTGPTEGLRTDTGLVFLMRGGRCGRQAWKRTPGSSSSNWGAPNPTRLRTVRSPVLVTGN